MVNIIKNDTNFATLDLVDNLLIESFLMSYIKLSDVGTYLMSEYLSEGMVVIKLGDEYIIKNCINNKEYLRTTNPHHILSTMKKMSIRPTMSVNCDAYIQLPTFPHESYINNNYSYDTQLRLLIEDIFKNTRHKKLCFVVQDNVKGFDVDYLKELIDMRVLKDIEIDIVVESPKLKNRFFRTVEIINNYINTAMLNEHSN